MMDEELTPEEDAEVEDLSVKATQLIFSESGFNAMNFELYSEYHFDEIVAFGYLWGCLVSPIFYDLKTKERLPKFVARQKRFVEIFHSHYDLLLDGLRQKKIRRMPRFEYLRIKNEPCLLFHCALWAKETIPSGTNYFWPKESIGMPNNVERTIYPLLKGRTSKPKKLKDKSGMSAHHIISRKLLIHFDNALQKCRNSNSCPITDRLFYLRERNCRKLYVAKFWFCPDEKLPGLCQCNQPVCGRNVPQKLPAKFADYASSTNLQDRRDEMACWSPYGAVIMMGPGNRGPFDPVFRNEEFEIDSRPILGDDRYNVFYKLYKKMSDFKKKWSESSTVNKEMCREVDELELQRFLAYTLYPNEVPYNPEHWGERHVDVNDQILRDAANEEDHKRKQMRRYIGEKIKFYFIKGTQDSPMVKV